ncbi:MAG: hypothetical protein J6X77_01175 [Bacteroidales bacterium]|nr:hypothetical protein [Bacteroidales bacterium]
MNFRKFGILIIRSALLLSVFCTEAKAQIDSLQLDSTVLSAAAKRQLLDFSKGGVVHVELSELAHMPSVLGNGDPLHFVQMLPSMQTSSELDAGIHIQGCDHQHNLVALDGVPVYGVSHLMGIFSVFNPTHFRSMSYSTVASGVNRLGGIIDMHTRRSVPEKFGADASLGLVSGQGTLEIPLSGKSALIVSARKSLVDLLYGNYMKLDDMAIAYDFADANLSWIWMPGPEDRIGADFYYGYDMANTSMSGSGTYLEHMTSTAMASSESSPVTLDLFWRNMLGSLHWTHRDLDQTLYYTGFRLDTDMADGGRTAHLPSSIGTLGYRASWKPGPLSLGVDAAMHDVLPQNPEITGNGINYSGMETMRAFETSLSGGWRGAIGYSFEYEATLSAQWFLSSERKSYFGLSPQFAGTFYMPDESKLHLRAGVYRQYLFQTGLSNLGLPLEFWLPAGRYSDPQWSVGTSVSWDKTMAGGVLEFNSEVYYRKLGNQLEYVGGFQDLMDGTYSLEKSLRSGNGYACGLNLLLRKPQGRLTGWAGLSVGRSMRSFDGGIWPSNHERLVEFDMVGSYSVGRWDLGATVVAAGGTPFTEIREFYLLSNQIVGVLEEHNSARLKPYFRVDLNAKLALKPVGRMSHGLVFSVYNATLQKQEVYRTIKATREEGKFAYESMYLGITILPSVGYYLKF